MEDEHVGVRDEYEGKGEDQDEFQDENEDLDNGEDNKVGGNDYPFRDYDLLQHELFGN